MGPPRITLPPAPLPLPLPLRLLLSFSLSPPLPRTCGTVLALLLQQLVARQIF